jgi:hypothetical protein
MKKLNITDTTNSLYEKLVSDLPFTEEDNSALAQIVKEFLMEHPDRIHDLIGGELIPDEGEEV